MCREFSMGWDRGQLYEEKYEWFEPNGQSECLVFKISKNSLLWLSFK